VSEGNIVKYVDDLRLRNVRINGKLMTGG